MSFVETLKALMEDNATSNVALGKAIGVSDVAVMRWKKGETVPSLDNALGIARYYGISLDELSGNEQKVETNKKFRLPILGTVSAFAVRLYGVPTGEYIYTTNDEIDSYPREECYALKISDDSLNGFPKGTYLFIHQQNQCIPSDICG